VAKERTAQNKDRYKIETGRSDFSLAFS
jgi:hypothetical protein